ncbi:ribosomal RNA-processing protein 9 [Kwoniella heveanensis BCC8398]|uniref:Ribosomal RNA-processing protein 9 n=1 Tax=Kwoniella heveanensis BCC8398 TaxID=1296120 RepID=A0A1B9GRT8_9TREE|nr:ribosomal RNA-processing protein 9 [Kwoniella heveanensis BCC8398]
MPDPFFQSEKKRKRPNRSGGERAGGPSSSSSGSSRPLPYGKGQKARPQPYSRKAVEKDENLSSDAEGEGGAVDLDDMDFRAGREDVALSDDEVIDENETAAEKRVRLAKGYLAKVRDEVEAANADMDFDAAEIDRELIASRLQKDVAEASGRIHLYIASHLTSTTTRFLSVPSHVPTSIALTPKYLFVSTKRGSIVRYATSSLKKIGKPFGQGRAAPGGMEDGHEGEVLSIAASEDGKWLVSGGRDKVIGVWDVSGDEPKWVRGLRGHKDAVTSVALPPLNNTSHHILSASLSRHLALHSLATLSVIDTFFGHQDSIPSVSTLKPTLAVTAGSRDRTCRWWKVEEEVQLVFRGGGKTKLDQKGLLPEERKERLGGGWTEGVEPEAEPKNNNNNNHKNARDRKGKGKEFIEGSIDCVCMLDDQHFLSGGDSGSISLWSTGKKKPIFTHAFAHGTTDVVDTVTDETVHGQVGPRWITSLAALRGTNLFASGSYDGHIRLWAIEQSMKSFSPLNITIPLEGFINAIQFLSFPTNTISSSSFSSSSSSSDGSDKDQHKENDEDQSLKAGKSKSSGKGEIYLVAAAGQEPRLGRWMNNKKAKNGVVVARLELDDAGKGMMI